MHPSIKKHLISHVLTLFALTLVLSGCDIPEKPEGADVEGMTRIGDQLRAHGEDEGAADFYQRALQRDPKDKAARKSLGEILEAHGGNANAEALYAQGLAIDPQNADLLRAHGRVLLRLGRTADARDEYERALRLDSNDPKALNGLGIALDYLNQHAAAQKAYREALDADPNNLSTLNNLAHSLVLSGAYDEAIKLLEPHAQDRNATPALRQNLAEAYGLAGMEADAERMLRMDLPPAQAQRNLAYYKAQRVKLALVPKLYADLGSFSTEAMAHARTDEVKTALGDEMDGLIIATTPAVKTVGSTPSFTVRITGFATAAKLHAFCDKLAKDGIDCTAVMKE
jgi:Flp pilus assembly protein TadD